MSHFLAREENGEWREEHKLEAHSDWVRDVAWAPSIGLPHSTIASCSQDGRVIIWNNDESTGTAWTPKVGLVVNESGHPCSGQ